VHALYPVPKYDGVSMLEQSQYLKVGVSEMGFFVVASPFSEVEIFTWCFSLPFVLT